MEEQESLQNHFGTVSAPSIAGGQTNRSSAADTDNYIGVQIVSSSNTKWDKLHEHSASAVWG